MAILHSVENHVPIILCNKKHMPQIFCYDMYLSYHTTKIINEQVNWHENKKNEIWKKIVIEKIKNQRNNLLEFTDNKNAINKLNAYIENANNSTDTINTQEAVSAKIYFKELYGRDFRRSDDNIINACLNYGYSLLRSYIATLIVGKGLHPSIGINHNSILNNFNLADDIIEIFRPLVDYAVTIKLNYIEDFDKEVRRHLLNILLQKVLYNGATVSIKEAINLYIDSIMKSFN